MNLLSTLLITTLYFSSAEDQAPTPIPSSEELIQKGVSELIKMQEDGGKWPYEGVYRVKGEIPVGYQIGGTAIVATALLYAAPENEAAKAAIERGAKFILKALQDPLMEPSTKDVYDVRIWGRAFALDFFCRLRNAKLAKGNEKEIKAWIPKLIDGLVKEEIQGGGWNYANHHDHATFVTAPTVQALLLARSQGEKFPDEVLDRARKALEASRVEEGNFIYSGVIKNSKRLQPALQKQQPGAIARSPIAETTLILLGGGSPQAVQASLNAFFENWDELEKRRKKTGTHEGPYAIAPYYFYYGHRYAAQAIEMLPEKDRETQRERLLKVILKTRDEDGTWNDRVFPRSRNFGTAMIVLGLLEAKSSTAPASYKKQPHSW